MAKKSADFSGLIKGFRRLPPTAQIIIGVVVIGLIAYGWWSTQPGNLPGGQKGPPGTYLFCFWNVENLYDDEDDLKCDDRMEDWFAHDSEALNLKLTRLTEALLEMNGGDGPDILAMCEVESERSVELLRDSLNDALNRDGRADKKYEHIGFLKNNTGRRFAPAVLSRLKIEGNRVRKFGKGEDGRTSARTLVVPIRHNGYELLVMPSHWTSRITDEVGTRRMAYANDTYGEFKAIVLSNPDADVIVCGDFNDQFEDPSIREGLRATTAIDSVLEAFREPRMLALSGSVDRSREGTLYYDGNFQVFDHILLSRGMLDEYGWNYEEDTFSIFAPNFMRYRGEGPSSFGGESRKGERGYSDHFPVLMRIHVEGSEDET